MRGRRGNKLNDWKMRREDDRRRVALARTCFDRRFESQHIPHPKVEQVEVKCNLWESVCLYCNNKIYKRTDDAGMLDPWISQMLVIVEWP